MIVVWFGQKCNIMSVHKPCASKCDDDHEIPTGIPVLHIYPYKMVNVQFDLCIAIVIHKILGIGPVGECRQSLAILLRV